MPRALSTAIRARIKADLEAGHDIKTIMATHAISDKKARAMKKLYDNCGEVWLPKKKGARSGRPPKITPEHEERLRLYLADHPDAYIKEMCKFLQGACGMVVDESTMWRTVHRLGWQAQRIAKPRDEKGFWVQTLPREDSGNAVTTAQPGKPTKRREPATNLSPSMTRHLMAKTHDFVKTHMAQSHFDVSHDYSHVQRVLALSMSIQRVEQQKFPHIKFDETITELAALMHDIDDHKYQHPQQPQLQPPPPQQSSTSLPSPPSTSADPQYPTTTSTTTTLDPTLHHPPHPTTETHLLSLGWPPHIAIPVSIIATSISYTTETLHPQIHLSALRRFPELAVVQDADRLDALGAVGIGRAFAYGGARGRGLSETVAHFEDKLARLEGMMKTGEGRRLARARGERVGVFRGWVREEMGMLDAGDGVGGARNLEMGDAGSLGRREAAGRQLVDDDDDDTIMSVGDGDGDGGSSEDGDSSDSG